LPMSSSPNILSIAFGIKLISLDLSLPISSLLSVHPQTTIVSLETYQPLTNHIRFDSIALEPATAFIQFTYANT
jgi:hypothetical protein